MSANLGTIAARHGERILTAVKASGDAGLTDFELADQLGIYLSSVNCARNSLMRKKLVKDAGDRRPSGRGGTATVWVAA